MSLLRPTLGEMIDRMQIVRLKVEHTKDDDDRLVLIAEASELMEKICEVRERVVKNDLCEERVQQLSVTHKELWKREDEIRYFLRAGADEETATVAGKIVLLNDLRSKLIREISEFAGERVAKKTYA